MNKKRIVVLAPNSFERFLRNTAESQFQLVLAAGQPASIINLSAIDANAGVGGNQAFAFGGQNAATPNQTITWQEVGGNTFVRGEVNGNATPDFVLVLAGTGLGLTAADLVL